MPEAIDQLFAIATGSPWVLAVSVVALSWLWEDAAVIAAALLALDQHWSVEMAVIASLVGISTGDMGLYLLGRASHRWPRITQKITASASASAAQQRFQDRTLSNIFLIRFIPGLRTLGFTFCGLWRVPAFRFTLAMLTAGAVWVSLVFLLIHLLGSTDLLKSSPWKWSLMAAALILLVLNNTVVPKWLAKRGDSR